MLTKKQKQVARTLFQGLHSEEDILTQFNITSHILHKWLHSKEFKQELDLLHSMAQLETRSIITRFGPVAATRLAELIGSEKSDIARRAAVDLITMCLANNQPAKQTSKSKPKQPDQSPTTELNDQQLKNLLKAYQPDKPKK